MFERLSRGLAVIEALIVALPVTGLFLAFGPTQFLAPAYDFPGVATIAIAAIAMLAFAGICSGWVLLSSFTIGGAAMLRRRATAWRVLARAGVLLVLASAASLFLPRVDADGLSSFRFDFNIFSMAWPLLLPLAHLELELWLRSRRPAPAATGGQPAIG